MNQERFTPVEMGDSKLLLPTHIVNEAQAQHMASFELTPDAAEMRGQLEVIGTDGHGSIRAESREERQEDEQNQVRTEKLDKDIADMLDPRNILDLKASYDQKLEKAVAEGTLAVDKTTAASKQDAQQARADRLKVQLIHDYTQTGVKAGEEREVPDIVKGDIARLMDLSYEELESRVAKSKSATVTPEAPVQPDDRPVYGPEVPSDEVYEDDPITEPIDETPRMIPDGELPADTPEATKKGIRQRMRDRWNAIKVLPVSIMDKDAWTAAFGSTQEGKEGKIITRRRLLGAAAVIAAGAAVYWATQKGVDINPFDGDGLDLNPFDNDSTSTNNINPSDLTGGDITTDPSAVTPLDVKPGSSELPWNVWSNSVGAEHATPKIMELTSLGEQHGFSFTGHGGGGAGMIDSVTYNGQTYTDLEHINGALEYINHHFTS